MTDKKSTKTQKMSLGDFLTNDDFGSWADDTADLPSAPQSKISDQAERIPSEPLNRPYSSTVGGSQHRERSRGGFDRGNERRGFDRKPDRPQAAIPTEPPFTLFVGNLPFDATEDALCDFLENVKISNTRLMKDHEGRLKGFAYVECQDVESLKAGLEFNGKQLSGRPIRIDVAEQRTDSGRPQRDGRYERSDRGGRDGYRRGGLSSSSAPRDDKTESRDWRSSMAPREFPKQEIPSSEPKFNKSNPSTRPVAIEKKPSKPKFDPFGGAKPIDVTDIEKRIEERLKKKHDEIMEEITKEEEEEDVNKDNESVRSSSKPRRSPSIASNGSRVSQQSQSRNYDRRPSFNDGRRYSGGNRGRGRGGNNYGNYHRSDSWQSRDGRNNHNNNNGNNERYRSVSRESRGGYRGNNQSRQGRSGYDNRNNNNNNNNNYNNNNNRNNNSNYKRYDNQKENVNRNIKPVQILEKEKPQEIKSTNAFDVLADSKE